MKKVAQKNNLKRNVLVTIVFVLMSTLLLSFAYASSSVTARMENIMAQIRPRGNAIITGFMTSTIENGGGASSLGYNVHNVYGSLSLPNADSSVTFKVDVSVLLSPEMKITNVSGLDSNLEYEFTNYTLEDIICNTNDECNMGATAELYMTIRYKSGGYNSSNTNYAFNLDYTFAIVEYIAKIGSNRYNTLNAAVAAVPKNNVETTVMLLQNTSEKVTVAANQNVKFDFQGNTVSNKDNNPVITNNGTITITNGIITSSANQGAINNETTGVINMSGGKIMATAKRQAIYNGGIVNISGDAYLSAVSTERAPLQNLATGTVNLTGGTILSTGFYGIENLGTLTIGTKDGNVNSNYPFIKGETYGVYTTPSFKFYDGIIEGKTDAVNDEQLISEIETDTEILHAMDGSHKKISLGEKITITFNANGGSVSESSREISIGTAIGTLPVPTRNGFDCVGWFTAASGGTQILPSTVFNADDEIFAHWEIHYHYVADISGTKYETLQDAVDAVPTNNTKVVITILDDIDNENIIVASGKNIEFDIGSYTISNTAGTIIDNYGTIEIKNGKLVRNGSNDQNRVIQNRSGGNITISGGDIKSNNFQVIRNYGTLNITGGKIWASSNVDQGIINNESGGTFTISGGEVLGTKRQAIYNDGGTLLITGTVVLTNGNGATANRACVQNHTGTTTIAGGTITSPSSAYPAVLNERTMTITGGTITSNAQNGVNNTSNLTIGVKDGNIDATSPTIRGTNYGVNNTSTFKFYDGIIKGANNSINGSIAEMETNSTRVDGTEDIGGVTYHTTHLE